MRYNRLGRTGLFVSEMCLGAMTFGGGPGIWNMIGAQQQDEADLMIRTALDAGINFIDTANVYSQGRSEEILGQSLKNLDVKRSDVVIATKVHSPMGEGPNDRGCSRAHIMDQVEQSLERLQLDHIDLYQIHGWDPLTPIDEVVRTLDDLVRSGLVHYVGVSNWAAWQIQKALGVAERQNLARFECVQAYYSIAGRDLERELAPMMAEEALGLMVWSPLAAGFLTGKYTREGDAEGRRTGFDFPPVNKDRAYDCIDAMREIGAIKGVSIARIALAWLLHQPVVSTIIIGATKIEQLQDNLGACDVELSAEELDRLDKVSKLPLEYPGWMTSRSIKDRIRQSGHNPRIRG